MPRHPEVLTELSDTASDYVLQQPQPESIPGDSVSRAVYQHRSSHELWLAQSPAHEDAKQTQQAVLREKIAHDIYAYYGVPVPRLVVAQLPCHYPNQEEKSHTLFDQKYEQKSEIKQAPHLLSRQLDRFKELGYMPLFQTGMTELRVTIDDQGVPEQGLGCILAVAHFIQDVDVIGSSGHHIGYTLSLTPEGSVYAQSGKINAREVFFEYDQPYTRQASRQIYLATSHTTGTTIPFDRLPLPPAGNF